MISRWLNSKFQGNCAIFDSSLKFDTLLVVPKTSIFRCSAIMSWNSSVHPSSSVCQVHFIFAYGTLPLKLDPNMLQKTQKLPEVLISTGIYSRNREEIQGIFVEMKSSSGYGEEIHKVTLLKNQIQINPMTPASNCLRPTPDFLAFFWNISEWAKAQK